MSEDLVQAFIFLTGVAGQLFIAHKNAVGFWVWIATNIALVGVSVHKGLPGMAALYVFFTAMCFYSIWKWNKSAQPA